MSGHLQSIISKSERPAPGREEALVAIVATVATVLQRINVSSQNFLPLKLTQGYMLNAFFCKWNRVAGRAC